MIQAPPPRQNRDPLAPQNDNAPRGNTGGPQNDHAPNTPSDNAWTRKLGGQHASGSARPVRTRPTTVQENAAAMWGALSGTPVEEELPSVAPGVQVPRGFDVKDFLEGARVLYSKLQTAWAARELEGLIPFTTPEMMLLLQKQAAKNPEPSTVDIVLVNAELEKFLEDKGQDTATVLFHVTMRFGENATPEVIDEIWHFVRTSADGGTWRLSGIDAA
ncbi:39S ribosomal protein L45 [Desulfovibrio sp. OttesenSCG-928-G15]|nr:39S ribosomal protein L45 [Desulfovibrio sp. OttesenSCG-928-G15]